MSLESAHSVEPCYEPQRPISESQSLFVILIHLITMKGAQWVIWYDQIHDMSRC